MYVIGIDPGLTRCGYAVLRSVPARSIECAGVIETSPNLSIELRLAELFSELCQLFTEFPPEVVVVERVLFQTNAKTAMSVGQASGVALVAAANFSASVASYSSNEVKMTLCGTGSATKREVQRMVEIEFALAKFPEPPDVADAIGLAYHHQVLSERNRVFSGGKR